MTQQQLPLVSVCRCTDRTDQLTGWLHYSQAHTLKDIHVTICLHSFIPCAWAQWPAACCFFSGKRIQAGTQYNAARDATSHIAWAQVGQYTFNTI